MSSQRRQTQLIFTPLLSSPAAKAKAYPAQIQQRVAAVRHDEFSSPTRKGRIAKNSPITSYLSPDCGHASQGRKLRSGNISLPTPVASSQTGPGKSQGGRDREVLSLSPDSTSHSETECPLSTKTFGRFARISKNKTKHQSTPEFPRRLGAKVASPQIVGYHPTEPSPVQVDSDPDASHSSNPSKRRRGKGPTAALLSSDDDSDPVLSKPSSKRRYIGACEESSPTPRHSTPSKALTRQKSIETLSPTYVSNITEEDRLAQLKRKTRSSTRNNRFSRMVNSGTRNETETDDSEEPVRLPPKRVRRRLSFLNSMDPSTDELAETTRHPSPKTRRPAVPPISVPTSSSKITDDSSEDAVVTPGRRLRKKIEPSPKIDSDLSEDEVVTPRRRLHTRIKPSPKRYPDSSEKQVADDLREDMEHLRESEIRETRTRGTNISPRQSEKQKKLEMLRRHHACEKPIDVSSDNEGSSKSGHYGDQTSEDEDVDSRTEAVRQSLHTNTDEYEEDFVDDDDDGNLGAPHGLDEIPLQFTSRASKKPIDYFRDTVEWMVHNELNPAFDRNHERYGFAVHKLDDVVQGFAGSKFVSSVWKDEFTKALKSRPDMEFTRISASLEHNCEACPGHHPATYHVTFKGKLYNRHTLEEFSEDDDDDDDNEDVDAMSIQSQKEDQAFYLGRNCQENAAAAHGLFHWRFQLNFYVLQWLRNHGHLSEEKILERYKWNTKKKQKYSDQIVARMDARGDIRTLYKEFKQNLELARSDKPKRNPYGSR